MKFSTLLIPFILLTAVFCVPVVTYHSQFSIRPQSNPGLALAVLDAQYSNEIDGYVMGMSQDAIEPASQLVVLPVNGVYRSRSDPVRCGDSIYLATTAIQGRHLSPITLVSPQTRAPYMAATFVPHEFVVVCSGGQKGEPWAANVPVALRSVQGGYLRAYAASFDGNLRAFRQVGLGTPAASWVPVMGVFFETHDA